MGHSEYYRLIVLVEKSFHFLFFRHHQSIGLSNMTKNIVRHAGISLLDAIKGSVRPSVPGSSNFGFLIDRNLVIVLDKSIGLR